MMRGPDQPWQSSFSGAQASTIGSAPVGASLAEVLTTFDPLTLEALDEVALLRRLDTKLVLRETQLVHVLTELNDGYRVLEISGRRQHRYRTQYFDTPDLAFYRQHHNGQRDRYKVRIRAYVDCDQAFLEVKRKTNREITIKDRWELPSVAWDLTTRSRDLLAGALPYPVDGLTPTLWNRFQRITLVSRRRPERLTVDVGVSFGLDGRGISLPGVAVVEIKQPLYAPRSALIGRLRALDVRPLSFSKYCVGISLLLPRLKQNHFKPHHRLLARLTQKGTPSWTIPSYSD